MRMTAWHGHNDGEGDSGVSSIYIAGLRGGGDEDEKDLERGPGRQ
jgi:hypothetical protein